MISKENNFAYIDGSNLHKGIKELGWKLNYHRFRIWLKEKHGITRAYLFLGLVPKYKDLYTNLQEAGFTLVFKETTCDGKCSFLLRKLNVPLVYLDAKRSILKYEP